MKAIYTVYGKAYDPRAGSFLTVYLPSLEVSEKVEELIKKHFGAFSYRTKQDCKVSSYRCYNKHAIDLIIEETEWYKLSLNLIFNDNPYDDMKKYDKFSKKAPQGIKY